MSQKLHRIQWTREKILAQIKEMAAKKLPLNCKAVYISNGKLLQAACKRFGSWDAALRAAGIDPESVRVNKKWSKTRIIVSICERYRGGKALSSRATQCEDKRLYSIACLYFGTWESAVTAAGFAYNQVRITKKWSAKLVLIKIRKHHSAGISLRESHMEQHDPALVGAARTYFGNWRSAVTAAKLVHTLRPPHNTWTKALILERIRELMEQGLAINSGAVQKSHVSLHHAALYHYGSWGAAIEAVGLSYDSVRQCTAWNNDKILHGIRDRHEMGLSLSVGDMIREDPSLYYSAYARFGNWANAIKAAGFSYASIAKVWLPRHRVHALQPHKRGGSEE